MSRSALVAFLAAALAGGSAMAAWFAALGARRGTGSTGLVVLGFALGIVGGVLLFGFGWTIWAVLGPAPDRLPLRAGEEILVTRSANHSRGLGGSGYLTLTTQRLLFHARRLSFRRAPVAIDLASVTDVGAVRATDQLAVIVGDRAEVFAVHDGADLAALIRNLANAPEVERPAVLAAWRAAPPP